MFSSIVDMLKTANVSNGHMPKGNHFMIGQFVLLSSKIYVRRTLSIVI